MKTIESIAKKHYIKLPYHNWQHALAVRENALKFVRRCRKYKLNVNWEVLEIAILFHDAGYYQVKKDKEKHSCKIAEQELDKLGYPKKFISQIKQTIMATALGYPLRTIEQKIIRASDLKNFTGSYKNFLTNEQKIVKEYKILYQKDNFPIEAWTALVKSYLKPKIQLTPKYYQDNFHAKAKENIKRFLTEFKK